ncbi:biotin synthase related domain containing protein [Lachnospiraceae bacterium KM106-2]|nr:biotin synthase related domain containing protein [Lachnospiraceae bacterium KM106-2]
MDISLGKQTEKVISKHVHVEEEMTIQQKLAILSDAAKYDVACTSSGVSRKGVKGTMGNAAACGICHTFAADGRCISLLKILFTNECIYDCKYCINRSSNDVKRTSFTPEEVCQLTMEFYRRNYIEGLFLSSGIKHSPNETMEQIYQTLYLLRNVHQFNGYIHVKAIPGADESLIERTGWLADRMSINLELPTAEGLRKLAPNKTRNNILRPMKQIQIGIHDKSYQQHRIEQMNQEAERLSSPILLPERIKQNQLARYQKKSLFVPAGQSTQMIIGATPENDYEILSVSESLYDKFQLKRVFYSGYIPINEDRALPSLEQKPPMLREHRLYQADWLLRFYGFDANELLSKERPNFNVLLDPKCDWAIRNLDQFPIEINKAPYQILLRIPGIGVKSAQRIVKARRMATLDFSDLKKIGVVLKRALYFITCKGKMMYPVKIEENFIVNHMLDLEDKRALGLGERETYQQISLFDTSLKGALVL